MFRLKRREFTVRNNGVKAAPFHVLLGAQMPAVLVELGYCTNPAEARNLADPKYRHALAEGLAEGILAYKDRPSQAPDRAEFLDAQRPRRYVKSVFHSCAASIAKPRATKRTGFFCALSCLHRPVRNNFRDELLTARGHTCSARTA